MWDKTPERLVKTDHIEIKYREGEDQAGEVKVVRKEQSQGQFQMVQEEGVPEIRHGKRQEGFENDSLERVEAEKTRETSDPGDMRNAKRVEGAKHDKSYRSSKRHSDSGLDMSRGSFIDQIKSEVMAREGGRTRIQGNQGSL